MAFTMKKHILIPAAALVLSLSACRTTCPIFTSYQAHIDYYANGGERPSPTIHFTPPFLRYDDFPEKHKEEIEARRQQFIKEDLYWEQKRKEKEKSAGLPPTE